MVGLEYVIRPAVTVVVLVVQAHAACGRQSGYAGPSEPVRETESCVITRIVDGDTIECTRFGRIRLIGIDTPEGDQAPFGEMASDALATLAAQGDTVSVERDVELRDQYGRLLAYVWLDSAMVNFWLVREGWAVTLTYPPNVQYVDWFRDAEQRAREEGRGLWAVDGFDCRPRAHRRGQC